MSRKIYLAGPEVFLPDPHGIAGKKKAICSEYGFEGLFPLDAQLQLEGLTARQTALRISRANEGLMQKADLLIANMTPFRGPSMDVGTAYEMGYMRALGRPVLGYTNAAGPYHERAIRLCSGRRQATRWVDHQEMEIEDFDLPDNLMMAAAVIDSGAEIIEHPAPADTLFTDLTAFTACVRLAREIR